MPPVERTAPAEIIAMMQSIAENIPMPVVFDTPEGLVPIEEFVMPKQNVGVAQSAEQVPRKDEAVGSTPTSSSTGLSREQHEIIANYVHHQVGVIDNRKAIADVQTSLKKLESDYEIAKVDADRRIVNCSQQVQFHIEQMHIAEENLRRSILSDVLIKGAPEPEPTPEAEIEHDDQIGRAG